MNRVAMLIVGGARRRGMRDVVRATAGDRLGRRLVYPVEAKDKKVEGYVRVAYDVSVDGSVTNVRVVDSNPPGVFDEAAVAAVRGWRFHPAIGSDGKPVVKELVSRVNFKLGESEGYAR